MFDNTVEYFETLKQKTRLIAALNNVCVVRPYLSGLASLLKIYVSNLVDSAGITATGRLLINPEFLERQNLQELAFVIAHELMHLVLQTHEREGNYPDHNLINIAHDFIINDDIMDDFAAGMDRPPANALHWPDYRDEVDEWKPASEYSLEELVIDLKRQNIVPKKSWNNGVSNTSSKSERPLSGGGGCGSLGDLLKEAGINVSKNKSQSDSKSQSANSTDTHPKNKQGAAVGTRIKNRLDVISEEDELKAFPELSPKSRAREQKSVQQVANRSRSEAVLMGDLGNIKQSWRGLGGEAGNYYKNYSRLQDAYHVPWEMGLQRWFDSVAPGDRSFAKASRRGAWRTDVVLPGRKREGWTLHIVLDTSGSMIDILPKALGAIAYFCESNNVETVRVIQIDTIIHQDEFIDVQSLENIEILGLGGNDMQPAWDRLMEDPEIEAVVVVSDGGFDVPPEPPFQVLWAITDDYYKSWFNPTYGTVVYIENMG